MVDNQYVYSVLHDDKNIRLLRLLPSTDRSNQLRCQLFEYPLSQGNHPTHLYEALSYTWGTSQNKRSVLINGRELPITANCHAALVQLRDSFIERILWVDSICIDQSNIKEREAQVRIMAEVYCKSRQVIVWLGEASSDSEDAMDKIRATAEGRDSPITQDSPIPKSVTALLERPWFRRVWVLQEVAAAQHVVLVCGAAQIDGYAFCLGLAPYIDAFQGLGVISSVEYLIRGSIMRPKYTKTASGLITLGIRPLGELMDMYHAHEASEPLDKIFALLGMSTDGLSTSDLMPNYSVSWNVLLRRLVAFLVGDKVSAKTSDSNKAAVISGQGTIIGKVTSVAPRSIHSREIQATMEFMESYKSFWPSATWSFHPGIKRIQKDDILCLLEGAKNPTLIRQSGNCFSIIMISVTPTQNQSKPLQGSILEKFVLTWNLEDASVNAHDGQLGTWFDAAMLGCVDPHPNKLVKKGHLLKLSAHTLTNACQFEAAIDLFKRAMYCYNRLLAMDDRNIIECLASMAVAHGNLRQWYPAKKLWEYIMRTCYASSYPFMQIADFFDKFLPILTPMLEQFSVKDGAKKWQAIHDTINAKRSRTPLQDGRILEMVEFLDAETLNILIDLNDHWPVGMERTLMAAARNENDGLRVMRVILDRMSNDLEITERVFIAAAGNTEYSQKLIDMLLYRMGRDAQITQDYLQSAAGNIHNNRTRIHSLLGCQGIKALATLPSFTMGFKLSKMKEDTLILAKAFARGDNPTVLQTIISATDSVALPQIRRELYQFAWAEFKFESLDELIQILPPALEDIVATLAHLLISNCEHAVDKLLALDRRQMLGGTNTDMVHEEVVVGCSKLIEYQSPTELLRFLDCLTQIGISFCSYRKGPLPTQSAILPATLSKEPQFLKILIENNVVSPWMRPFIILSHKYTEHDMGAIDEGVFRRRYPPDGMPDWPLYCAIILTVDPQFIDFLCRSGARIKGDSGIGRLGTRPAIITELEEPGAFERFRYMFDDLLRLCHNMANAQLDPRYKENELGDCATFEILCEKSFEQAWRSLDNMLHWKKYRFLKWNCENYLPRRLENEWVWDIWRTEVLHILKSF